MVSPPFPHLLPSSLDFPFSLLPSSSNDPPTQHHLTTHPIGPSPPRHPLQPPPSHFHLSCVVFLFFFLCPLCSLYTSLSGLVPLRSPSLWAITLPPISKLLKRSGSIFLRFDIPDDDMGSRFPRVRSGYERFKARDRFLSMIHRLAWLYSGIFPPLCKAVRTSPTTFKCSSFPHDTALDGHRDGALP